MNFFKPLLTVLALSIPVTLIACSSAPDASDEDGEEAESTEEALTARQTLQGTWKDANGGLNLRPSGQFFWEKDGDRTEGSWTANKRYTKLTLNVGGSKTVYRYIYSPAIVANGFPGPSGSLPRIPAKLELQQLTPMTTVAVVHKLKQVDSWCSSSVDCMQQKQDGTWDPSQTFGSPTCKPSTNSCSMGPAATDTLVASCNPAPILNGFVNPETVYRAEIIRHQPIILNGFALPSYNVVIKRGGNVEAKLESCTGNLEDWNLHCSPGPNAPLGVMRVFDTTNEAQLKATYKKGALSPTAPVTTQEFRCTLENE